MVNAKKSAETGKRLVWATVILLGVLVAYNLTAREDTPVPQDFDVGDPKLLQFVEYSDFICPYCGKAAQTVEQLRVEYAGRVNFVYMQFPLPFHTGSDKAAEASECAKDQGKFWEYHDKLFEGYAQGRDTVSASALNDIAIELGLDGSAFGECLDSGAKKKLVEQHIDEGKKLGVTGTPTFFIGGQKVVGAQDISVFRQVMDYKLNETKSVNN